MFLSTLLQNVRSSYLNSLSLWIMVCCFIYDELLYSLFVYELKAILFMKQFLKKRRSLLAHDFACLFYDSFQLNYLFKSDFMSALTNNTFLFMIHDSLQIEASHDKLANIKATAGFSWRCEQNEAKEPWTTKFKNAIKTIWGFLQANCMMDKYSWMFHHFTKLEGHLAIDHLNLYTVVFVETEIVGSSFNDLSSTKKPKIWWWEKSCCKVILLSKWWLKWIKKTRTIYV